MTGVRLAVLAALVLTVALNPASARAGDPASPGAVRIIEPGVDRIEITVNKGTMIRLPKAASSVFVANPEVAGIVEKSPELVYVTAKRLGETTFLPWTTTTLRLPALTLL